MKVLVTGGTGTISSGIVKECVNRGYETYAITRGNKPNRNIYGVKYLRADVSDDTQMEAALKENNFDVVVDCLVYNLDQLKRSLIMFSSRCKQYVFISTAGVYNRNLNARVRETDEKLLVEWEYSRDKIRCEEYLISYCNTNHLNYTIVRPTVTYGDYRVPFPITTRNPGWTFFQRMLDGRPMLACDNVKFSIIHIDDFSYAVVSLFGNPKAMNEDFHIVDNNGDIYWDDVIYTAGHILGINPNIVHVPVEDLKVPYQDIYDEIKWNKSTDLLLDDKKLKEVVSDFRQKISLEEGIIRIIRAMKEEFEKNSLTLDQVWNERCDMALLYSLYRKHIIDEEKICVKRYKEIGGVSSVKMRLKLLKRILKYEISHID